MFKRSTFYRTMGLLMVFSILAFPLSGASTAPLPPPFPPSNPEATEGYILDPEFQISTALTPVDPDRNIPEMAYNSVNSQFLVVWHNSPITGHYREVYGQRIGTNGQKIGSQIVISAGTNDRKLPAVAYNPGNNEYMVVFMYDENGDGSKFAIRSRRINGATGALVGSEVTIISIAGRSYHDPQIAWNSTWNEYLVVWTTLSTATGFSLEIGGMSIDDDASHLWDWVITNQGVPSSPDITWDPVNHKYFVIWNFLNASGKLGIKGDLRDHAGNDIQPIDIYSSTTNHVLHPRISSSMGLFYMATFEYENTVTDHDIWVALISSDATACVPAPYVTGTTHDVKPDIAGSSNKWEYMITYQRASGFGADVLMRPFSNYMPDDDIELCNDPYSDCTDPVVFYGGWGYMNAYTVNVLVPTGPETNQPETPVTVNEVWGRRIHTFTLNFPIAIR